MDPPLGSRIYTIQVLESRLGVQFLDPPGTLVVEAPTSSQTLKDARGDTIRRAQNYPSHTAPPKRRPENPQLSLIRALIGLGCVGLGVVLGSMRH